MVVRLLIQNHLKCRLDRGLLQSLNEPPGGVDQMGVTHAPSEKPMEWLEGLRPAAPGFPAASKHRAANHSVYLRV